MKKHPTISLYNKFWKRIIDLFLSFFLILLLSPVLLVISLLVFITSGFPIFYTPLRGGYLNKSFKIIKYRTMVKNADKIGGGTTALNDKRITKIGKFLRKTKLDEIPQLFNIFVGQMSFIGPRPELLQYTEKYNEDELIILKARPGLTDFSSLEYINLDEIVGSNSADEYYERNVLKNKNALRIKYANSISFKTDFILFFKTAFRVIKKALKFIFCRNKTKQNNMEYVTLKNSNLKVSRICMGGCPMGGYGWGKTNEKELIKAVKFALKSGINFFDTADTYGLGQSEKTLAKGLGRKRKEAIIQSKFGVRRENGKTFYDNSPEYIEEALNNTLKRLKTSYLDIYTIHYRDNTPLSVVVEKLLELQKQGKIRYFGISNIKESEIAEYKKFAHLFVDCQNEFSLACRTNEHALNEAVKELNVTPLTWGSLGQGILTGKYDKNVQFGKDDRRSRPEYINFHGDKLIKNLEIVNLLRTISEKHEKSISSCAIRFILDYLKDSVVLVGVKTSKQLQLNLEAIGWKLDDEEVSKLNELSLR